MINKPSKIKFFLKAYDKLIYLNKDGSKDIFLVSSM